MAHPVLAVTLALLVAFSAGHAEAGDKGTPAKTGHASPGPIVFTKHSDKASPYLAQ